jgi:hypothetical protein
MSVTSKISAFRRGPLGTAVNEGDYFTAIIKHR